MERNLSFKDSLVDGETKRFFESLLPQLKNTFHQRKQYDEYFFGKEIKVDLDIGLINQISDDYEIKITKTDIVILN